MAVKVYKRNNAGRRKMSIVKPEGVGKYTPEKSLLKTLNKKVGRSHGKISVRHRGGGAKRKYRMIDFKMRKLGVESRVVRLEKDPNRSALIALLVDADGERRYILAVNGLKVGDKVVTKEKSAVKIGNRMMLKNIPVGTTVCNVEMFPEKGAQIVRSAGASAYLQAIDNGMAQIKLPSTEIRLINENCYATIGQVSNTEHNIYRIGKAGRKRHMGRRPKVRGSAMNPVDHPHGGGEGCQPIGLKYPKTPWGKPALGVKTRKKNKASNKYIVSRRKKRRR